MCRPTFGPRDYPQTKFSLPNLELPHSTPDSHEAIGLLRAFRPATSAAEFQALKARWCCHLPGQAWLVPFDDLRGYSSPDFGRALELASYLLGFTLLPIDAALWL